MAKNSVRNNGKRIAPGLYSLGDPRKRNNGFLKREEIHRIARGMPTLEKVLLEISSPQAGASPEGEAEPVAP